MVNGGGAAQRIARGEDGYEEARRAAVWNARTPDALPGRDRPGGERGRRRARGAPGARGGPDDRRALGRSQLGRQPPARRRACCSTSPRLRRRSTVDAAAMTATRRSRAAAATSCSPRSASTTCSSPPATASGVGLGGYLLQGGLRLERPRARAGLHERRGDRRRDRRRRAGARRRGAQPRPAVGGARRGPGLLRRRHRASTCACTRRPRVDRERVVPTRSTVLDEVFALGARDRPARAARDGADAARSTATRRASSRSR